MTAPEKSFDRIADLYDRARPTYPDSVFERMLEFAGIDSSARVLEVGTGTGKATVPLARRGFAQLLRPRGALAVFGNAGGVMAGVLRDAIQAVYRQHAPALCGRDAAQQAYGSEQSPLFQGLRSSPLFTDAHSEITAWEQTSSSEDYCALQASYSDHSTLPPNQLEQVLSGIAKVIAEHGDTVPLQYRTGLFLARRA